MKKMLLTIPLLLAGIFSNAFEEIKVESKIDKVTVFLQGAQVFRTGNFTLKKGTNKVYFEGVTPNMDKNTLQAKGKGNFTILDVYYEYHYPQPDQIAIPASKEMPDHIKRKIRSLTDSIKRANYKLDELRLTKEVYDMERKMLLNNGTVKGVGKVNDSIPLLKDAMAYFHQKMLEINLSLHKNKIAINELSTDIGGMQSRLQELQNWSAHNNVVVDPPKGPVHRIVVTIDAEYAMSGTLEVGYIVTQAGWTPSYDIRGKDLYSDIDINYKAEVFQNTGIDWDNIPLTLSTNNPYSRQEKPVLGPVYINYYNPNQAYYRQQQSYYDKEMAKKAEKNVDDYRAGVANGSASPEAAYQLDLNNAAVSSRESYQMTETIQNMISAEYKINLKYNIRSNNERHIVGIAKKSLKSNYSLALVPKLDNNAFLIANCTKWEDLNLIPAKARIYYDGTYVGQSYIDPTAMEDTLKLAMGRDNSVTAIRKTLKKKEKERIIGDSKEKEVHYEITIRNSHGYSIEIKIEDQIPVSNNEDIKVEPFGIDKGKLNENTGIIVWEEKLKAGSTKKINFGYKVKFDKNKQVTPI